LIDLHLHTTASDGALSPTALVARAAAAGIHTLAVTDHDTVNGLAEAGAAARSAGVTFVPGIEITAVEDGRDVHVLGYFFDPDDAGLAQFLAGQREDRIRRVREIANRLAMLDVPIDVEQVLQHALESGTTVGRPHIAEALVAAGHAPSRDAAFERFLERSAPAFVPRRGSAVAGVIDVIRGAGGIASLAHPGLTRIDDRIPAFAQAGLDALEVRHSDHDGRTERRYRALAHTLGLAVSGGSDFHGEQGHHRCPLGSVSLEAGDLAELMARRGRTRG
jgi:predicted metal-dependent phosphoesterase TrpH